ncbi:MAG: hypothetical protein KDB82_11150, partial [Planctomycetes bacterium]|nr:hypothetical protein [Planctomycetota bacterium]
MAQQNKVASWYWIVSAVLTPFIMIACVVWAYYAQQVQSYRAEGTRLVAKVESDHAQLEPLLTHMKDTAAVTGWKMGDPKGGVNEAIGKASAPSVFQGEERTLPQDKRSPLLNAYLDAESRFYGGGDSPGYVHEYIAARDWLGQFEDKLKHYVALKSYQYYTVKTINIGGGDGAVVAEGDLVRAITNPDGVAVAPEAALTDAWNNKTSNKPPSDKQMQEPTKITLELIFRKQVQLLRDLVSADLHQYGLLFADVAGQVTYTDPETGKEETQWVGFRGEEESLKAVVSDLDALTRRVGDRKVESIDKLTEANETADNAITETNARADQKLQYMVVGAQARVDELADRFKNEKLTHETDAQKFEDLIRNLPRLKIPVKLEKSDPDGEISYSDYTRGVTHIDLGYSDGVRIGQRFEVWRRHGFEKDEFVGVVEIIRMLSAHYSLCTVLSLTDDSDPVRKGDQIVSKIWHDGKFLTIALHGNYEPPNEAYSKERLTELLKQLGCKVVDKVQPGTDLVILGSNLLGDEW